jgi:hypothetical protein
VQYVLFKNLVIYQSSVSGFTSTYQENKDGCVI